MTRCNYCGKEMRDNEVLQVGSNKFCNNLCRHSFDRQGAKPEAVNATTAPDGDRKPKKPSNATTLVSSIVGAIVAAVVGVVVSHNGVSFFAPDVTSMQVLNHTASEINKSLPMMLDAETELSTTVGIDGMLQYHYRLVNYSAGQIDTNTLMPQLRKSITNNSCSIKETRDLLNKGVTLQYVYHDKNGRVISTYDLTKSRCKECGL